MKKLIAVLILVTISFPIKSFAQKSKKKKRKVVTNTGHPRPVKGAFWRDGLRGKISKEVYQKSKYSTDGYYTIYNREIYVEVIDSYDLAEGYQVKFKDGEFSRLNRNWLDVRVGDKIWWFVENDGWYSQGAYSVLSKAYFAECANACNFRKITLQTYSAEKKAATTTNRTTNRHKSISTISLDDFEIIDDGRNRNFGNARSRNRFLKISEADARKTNQYNTAARDCAGATSVVKNRSTHQNLQNYDCDYNYALAQRKKLDIDYADSGAFGMGYKRYLRKLEMLNNMYPCIANVDALKRANKGLWWIVVGAVGGVGTYLGIKYLGKEKPEAGPDGPGRIPIDTPATSLPTSEN